MNREKTHRSASDRRSACGNLLTNGPVALIAAVLLTSTLGGCGSGSEAPGAVSAGEQKALDDAAAMVEGQTLDPAAIPSAPAGNAAGQPPAASPVN